MNDKLANILKGNCPVCSADISRDVHQPPVFTGKPFIVWKCTNADCEESTHWNKGGEHRRRYGLDKMWYN